MGCSCTACKVGAVHTRPPRDLCKLVLYEAMKVDLDVLVTILRSTTRRNMGRSILNWIFKKKLKMFQMNRKYAPNYRKCKSEESSRQKSTKTKKSKVKQMRELRPVVSK